MDIIYHTNVENEQEEQNKSILNFTDQVSHHGNYKLEALLIILNTKASYFSLLFLEL